MKYVIVFFMSLVAYGAVAQIHVRPDSLRFGNANGTGSVGMFGRTYLKNITAGNQNDSILVRNSSGLIRFVKRSELSKTGIPIHTMDNAETLNSTKIVYNTTLKKLRVFDTPTQSWRDAIPVDFTPYYTKVQLDALLVNKESKLTLGSGLVRNGNTVSLNPTSVSNSVTANKISTTVNGVSGASVPIVSTNVISLDASSIKTNVNGLQSNLIDLNTISWGKWGNAGINAATNFIGTTDDKPFIVKTNNTERFRVTNTGGVAIGTAVTLSRLDIAGDIASNTVNASVPIMRFLRPRNHNVKWGNAVSWNLGSYEANNNLLQKTRLDLLIGDDANDIADRIVATFQGNGRVGIGTTTPGSTLDIAGDAKAVQYKLSALNTPPANANASGTLGEIRVTADYIYVCIAANKWVRSALTTW